MTNLFFVQIHERQLQQMTPSLRYKILGRSHSFSIDSYNPYTMLKFRDIRELLPTTSGCPPYPIVLLILQSISVCRASNEVPLFTLCKISKAKQVSV